jgi:histidinol-phosphatase (PHP family)
VLIGSVHWLGTWQLDDIDNEVNMHQWMVRDVDQCWKNYGRALDELCATHAVDVIAHPDLIKVAGYFASNPAEVWDAMADSAARVDISMECSSAGWKKPVQEQYPAEGFLDRLVAKGLTFTTASDAHRLERVGERANDLAAMLEARGVNQLASYTQRQRQMIPLRAQ